MKIIRDGKEIELTAEEIEACFREKEKEYRIEDLKKQMEDGDIDLKDIEKIDKDEWDFLTERFDHILSNNDSYWESYWESASAVIGEFINRQPEKIVNIPSWAVNYLMNDDSTGLKEEDIQKINIYMALHDFGSLMSIAEGEHFENIPAFGLASNCMTGFFTKIDRSVDRIKLSEEILKPLFRKVGKKAKKEFSDEEILLQTKNVLSKCDKEERELYKLAFQAVSNLSNSNLPNYIRKHLPGREDMSDNASVRCIPEPEVTKKKDKKKNRELER